MVDNQQDQTHQIEVEVGDTIHTKCGCRGLCDAITGGKIHRVDLLERLDGPVPVFNFGRNSFVPESDPLMIRDDKLWTPRGVEGIHRIEKGGAADKVERYLELLEGREWLKTVEMSSERWDELWEAERDTMRLVRAVAKGSDTYAQKVAYAAKVAGLELDERQLFILSGLFASEASRLQEEFLMGSAMGSLLGGPLGSLGVLDLGSIFGGFRSPSETESPDEAAVDETPGTTEGCMPPNTEEAEAS